MLSVDKKVLQNLLFPKKFCKFTEYFLAEARKRLNEIELFHQSLPT